MTIKTDTIINESQAPPKFANPYASHDVNDMTRISTLVSNADYYLIKLIRPELRTITAVLGTLWSKLCYELRNANITDNTRSDDFESFVASCHILSDLEYNNLLRRAASGPDDQANGPDVGRGTPGVRRVRPAKSPKRTDVQSVGNEGQQTQGGTEGKAE